MFASTYSGLFSFLTATAVAATALSNSAIFKNPVITRNWEQTQYTLQGKDEWENDNVTVNEAASSIAALKPSYVSSVIYLRYDTVLSQDELDGFMTIRNAVVAKTPKAKFDVALSLNPANNGHGFPSSDALVSKMKQLNTQLPLDGFWFDFLSSAQSVHPDWVSAAASYAHSQNQTIGGNVFDSTVPPNMDAIAFVDDADASNMPFGYGYSTKKINTLVANANGTIILGHMQSNPQNDEDTTESCVYMRNFTSTERRGYQDYWLSGQKKLDYTYMLPMFYPLCPGATSYSPLEDEISGTNETIYDYIKSQALARAN